MAQQSLSPEEKIAKVRAAHLALNRGELEGFLQIFRDDAVWHSMVSGRDYNGKPAIVEFLTQLFTVVDEWRVDVIDILANDQNVVAVGRNTIRTKDGRTLPDVLEADLYQLDEEGQVKEIWPVLDGAQWRRFFGLPEPA